MQLGAKHVETPYIELGQICTAIYFGFYALVPVVGIIENTLADLATEGEVEHSAAADESATLSSPVIN